jgi:hypothetical protein
MSSTEYHTKQAKYRQIYAIHTLPIRDDIFTIDKFSQLDAIVLEAYHPPQWWDKFRESPLYETHKPLLSLVKETRKPMYAVDVLTTPLANGIELLAGPLVDITGAFLAYSGISNTKPLMDPQQALTRGQFFRLMSIEGLKTVGGAFLASHYLHETYSSNTGESPEFMARLQSLRTHLIPTPRFGFRDAINARKIEEGIVPELSHTLKKKPYILVVAGAGHSGLKEDLQYKNLRDAYIGLHSAFGYLGLDTEHLNTISKVTITENDKFKVSSKRVKLF